VTRLLLTTHIRAPRARCFDLARSVELHTGSAASTRETAVTGRTSGPLGLLVERLLLAGYFSRFLSARNRHLKAVAESEAWRTLPGLTPR
jgi:hypothetical protein